MQVYFLKFRSNKQLIEETIPYLRWSIKFYAPLYGAEYSPGAGVAVQSTVWYPTGGALKKSKQSSLSFSGGGVRCSRGAFKNKQRNFKLGPRLQPAQTFLICSLCPFTIIKQHFPCWRIICQRYSTSFFAQKSELKIPCVVDISKVYLLSPHWRHSEEINVHCRPLLLFISSYCMWRYRQSSNTTLRILNPLCRHCPEKKDLIWCFGTKRSLLFLEEKKFWFTNNKINFLKEYSPARVKVVNENTSQSPEVLEFIFI